MKKKILLRGILPVFAVLLILISLPKEFSLSIKGITIAALAPLWTQTQNFKESLEHGNEIKITGEDGVERFISDEIQRLKIENLLVKNELHFFKELLQNETLIEKNNFRKFLKSELQSVPARVIYRSPSSWTDSLWINIGSFDNKALGKEVIGKNSPVVVGTAVVGVIDYLGNRQSRVRLITDPQLNPSVRVIRIDQGKTWFLAKGELRGSAGLEWRGPSKVLKGIGFNYDNEDEEGPSRDLRTGDASFHSETYPKMPIIQKGDLLITTGMDGVFPKGLSVAKVSHINPLKEGDYYYEIKATLSVDNFDNLTTLFVLPPSGYIP